MAKVCMINREKKRKQIHNRDAAKREALRAILKSESAGYDEKIEARDKLNKLPRDGARVRQRNRCSFTGRPHGYFREFGISRIALRTMANEGRLPGVKKSSW